MHLQDAKTQAPDMLVPYRDSFTSRQPGVLHQSKRVRSVQTIRLLLLSIHQLVWMGPLDLLEHSMSLLLITCLAQPTQMFMGMPTLCAPAYDTMCSVTLPPVLSCCAGLSSGPAYCLLPCLSSFVPCPPALHKLMMQPRLIFVTCHSPGPLRLASSDSTHPRLTCISWFFSSGQSTAGWWPVNSPFCQWLATLLWDDIPDLFHIPVQLLHSAGSCMTASGLMPEQNVLLLQFFLLFIVHAYSGLAVGKGTEPKTIGDGPWHWLWPCLVPWLLLQTATSLGWLHNVIGMHQVFTLLD